MSGVKVVSSVDTNMTHNCVSEKTTNSLHCKSERNTTMFKVINSVVESIVGLVHSAPLRVGSWFGNWDLMVYPLDDHALIFGLESIIFSKGLPLAQVGCLVSLDEDKFLSMCMIMKRKFR